MKEFKLKTFMVVSTMVIFAVTLAINEWVLGRFELVRGINLIYLPAGARLLCTLLFGGAGATGLLLASCLVGFFLFPEDAIRALAGGVLAALAPYATYRCARRVYGLHSSLATLTLARLLALSVACSIANPLLHHAWFALRGDSNLLPGFLVMFIGDLTGTLIVLYSIKALIVLTQAFQTLITTAITPSGLIRSADAEGVS